MLQKNIALAAIILRVEIHTRFGPERRGVVRHIEFEHS